MKRPAELARSAEGWLRDSRTGVATAALIMILAVSAALNFTGIGFGLPQLTHEDERLVAVPALNLLKYGEVIGVADDQPQYHYPHLYIHCQAAVFAAGYIWEHARGNVSRVDESGTVHHYRAKIHDLPRLGWWPRLYYYGRSLTALLGVAAVTLAFAVGYRLRSLTIGLAAAGALALSPLFVANSHYITVNAPAGFFALLSLFICLKLFRQPQRPLLTVFLAAFVGGLAVSTKYNAAAVAAALLLAVALTQRGTKLLQGLLLVPAGVVLGFFAGTPQALRQPTIFLQDVAQQIVHYRFEGHAFTEQPNVLLASLWFLFSDGLGVGLSLLALVGIYSVLRRLHGPGIVLVTAAVLFLLQMASFKSFFTRNLVIASPLLAVLCGYGALQLLLWAEKLRLPTPRLAVAVAVFVLALPSAWGSISISSLLASPNNFLVARDWIEENLPAGSRVLLEHSNRYATVPLREESGLVVERTPLAPRRALAESGEFDYAVTWKHGPHRVDHYRYDEAVFQPGGYEQIGERYGGDLPGAWRRFQAQWRLVQEFDPFVLGTQGPTILVWRPER